MKLTNQTMDMYLDALKDISGKATGKFGYAVARNMRNLSNELVEYQTLKNNTIRKYGKPNENGTSTIDIGTEAFDKYLGEMKEYVNIEHDVPLMMITQSELLSTSLNANEMLTIDFMIKEDADV